MYMNLKPNQHKRISFNPTTMTSLEFIGPPLNLAPPPPPKYNFLLRSPPHYFGLKILDRPLKLGWAATMRSLVSGNRLGKNVFINHPPA